MYMLHFKNAKHRNLNEIKSDLDKFFTLIDYISIFSFGWWRTFDVSICK